MIIIDKELERLHAQNRPIRVGLVGAGYMARGFARQIQTAVCGMRVVAISNRTIATARRAYAEAGVDSIEVVSTAAEMEKAISRGHYAISEDPFVLCESGNIDVVVEATGTVEFSAPVVLKAIEHGKHVVLSNAELDATLGPILKVHADRQGVVLTDTDGDEPGVAMNLYRFVQSIGFRPVVAGNLKGFINRHRTPETQQAFAAKALQRAGMITSFADGTKLSMETTVLANATGLKVATRGMYGPECEHAKDALKVFPLEEIAQGNGIVDYLLGGEPGTGAFVIGYCDDPLKRQYMNCFKMGAGPFFAFYTPYHLPQLQLPHTVARAFLFKDATVAPLGAPVCEVVTMAKRDLRAGEELDGIGGFMSYGINDNADIVQTQNLLPMGLSRGCRLNVDIPADQPIKYSDVVVPDGRFCDRLLAEQDRYFGIQRESTVPVSVAFSPQTDELKERN